MMRGGAIASAFDSCPAPGSDVQSGVTAKCCLLSKTPCCRCQSTSSLCTPQIKAIPNVLWHKWKLHPQHALIRTATQPHSIPMNSKWDRRLTAAPRPSLCYETVNSPSNHISLTQQSSFLHMKVVMRFYGCFFSSIIMKCRHTL